MPSPRAPILRASFLRPDELVIDSFAGGGGASTGIEAAIGRPVDIAINHSPEAIAMHRANHPETRHFCENIWQVAPRDATGGRPVGLAWFSPDCVHFSRAKGSAKRSDGRRGLAHVVIRWAHDVRPRVILLENVPEFATWGPLVDGQPDKVRAGSMFRRWVGQLRALGYQVEWRELVAADYGTPTTRKRLFLVARCDGAPISWPEQTHGRGRSLPWCTAAEIIDWSIPCPSIFERSRPLADATMRRIAEGLRRYVIEAGEPFIVPGLTGAERAPSKLVAAWLTKHYGGVVGHGVTRPIGTVTAKDHHSLTTASLVPAASGIDRADHSEQVRAFLISYYGTGTGQPCTDPLRTVTTRDRFGLVMVRGEPYAIADIGMRMLSPRELYAAQGFPADYQIETDADGRAVPKTVQIALAGNSVCPPVAAALVAANIPAARSMEAA